ncbi:hypothetical protein OG883_32635 [Streptomyces sp. NBC_01142]|uniref:hypothetical protein n=1 Tax=Streptomyces sp. NBC_01142 TaxID=2975865 RepID=UPI00224D21B6|nr:hypothetical protein [Streptomyces sp. NBC_01142]MCX4824522.1 hypothetical protein [Streptomyces sp. NBC_01142]
MPEHDNDPLAAALKNLAATALNESSPAPLSEITARGERLRLRRLTTLALTVLLVVGGMSGLVAAGVFSGSTKSYPPATTPRPAPSPDSPGQPPSPTPSRTSSSSSATPGAGESSFPSGVGATTAPAGGQSTPTLPPPATSTAGTSAPPGS